MFEIVLSIFAALVLASMVAAAAERRTASVGTHCRSDADGVADPRRTVFRRPEA